ncbi:MAG: Na+/H+ antiporter subunit E [Ignavibacteriales bacterium]|nr:Na+/H+ antiporter subunit E [Ignavibacteriales bacterium]
MKTENRSRIIVFVLSFLIWIALTNIVDIQEVIAGIFLSIIVSLIAGHFLVTTEKKKNLFIRFVFIIKYFFVFIWEMIKANLHVAYIVIHPKLPIKPGIVKIKTDLTKDSARTILANSITLTPGTMSVDINPDKNEYYIHWIDVLSKDPADIKENTRIISAMFEKILKEVFE